MSKGNSVAGEEEEEEVLSGLQPINQNWYFCIIAVYPFFHFLAVTTHIHTNSLTNSVFVYYFLLLNGVERESQTCPEGGDVRPVIPD